MLFAPLPTYLGIDLIEKFNLERVQLFPARSAAACRLELNAAFVDVHFRMLERAPYDSPCVRPGKTRTFTSVSPMRSETFADVCPQ